MQLSFENDKPLKNVFSKLRYFVGSRDLVEELNSVPVRETFDDKIVEFLNTVSRILMNDPRIKNYSDVVTFAFWIRKASMNALKNKYVAKDDNIHLGRGVAFHISPSNVPVNFAYSLVSGLIAGNSNVIRMPSKEFEQVKIIVDAINTALEQYEELRAYMICVKYERNKKINDWFSSICDIRVIWGGDQTITELRCSPLPPRSAEISFADRYSLALIDSETYMEIHDKKKVALDFYNDTYFSDQNACTSPRTVIWMGSKKEEAKELFWSELHDLVKRKYPFQGIMGVNKLTKIYLVAAEFENVKVISHEDNLVVRIQVDRLTANLMNFRENSGYFYEYDCEDVMELRDICNDRHCQTIGYIGNKSMFKELIMSGIKGLDRVVPIGKTMEFDLLWDGYELISQLSRTVAVQDI